jgi:signal transduction histidine kinase
MKWHITHSADKWLPKKAKRRLAAAAKITAAVGLAAGAGWAILASPAQANIINETSNAIAKLQAQHAVGAAVLLGIVIFAATTAIFYIRERNRWSLREKTLAAQISEAQSRASLTELLVGAETQILVTWDGRDSPHHIEGDIINVAGRNTSPLAFGTWLRPSDAHELEAKIEKLKARGDAFRLAVATLDGRHIETEGRAVGWRAVLVMRDMTGVKRALVEAIDKSSLIENERDSFRDLARSLLHPAWLRNAEGQLTWVNPAFAAAIEAGSEEEAVKNGQELLDRDEREAAKRARLAGDIYNARAATIVAGKRRMLDVTEIPVDGRSVGIAIDVTEVEEVRGDLERQMAAHERTLDALQTAVAVFDGAQRMIFHNTAYRDLWSLSADFLEQRPTDGEVLDRLRVDRRLPEQADFRKWKASQLGVYHAVEPKEDWWHLPDGRMLRVVISPNPRGGVTYLFDDISEQVHLESRYNALMRVQGETLDSLAEGVAVFGMDGRLKLCNPAFLELWHISPDMVELQKDGERAHVDQVMAVCAAMAPDDQFWDKVRNGVVGAHESRQGLNMRIARRNGSVVEAMLAPLPDGATLVTFADVTASVNVERALTERNEALESSARLRDDFVHHVSYELRSPLTTIIGFTQLLAGGTAGPLSEKQREYTGHITQSSEVLLTLVNDILDLATIDNGTVDLNKEPVDIRTTITAAAAGIADRLADAELKLVIDVPVNIGSLNADPRRLRQILFNLLSNAVGFSSPGQEVIVSARRQAGEMVLSVKDRGRGIPPEVLDKVFDRFESYRLGSRHRGVGLGLSIVRSFVELHGGRVEIDSTAGLGTIVTCLFPLSDTPFSIAAE